jgi:hypothetical protein
VSQTAYVWIRCIMTSKLCNITNDQSAQDDDDDWDYSTEDHLKIHSSVDRRRLRLHLHPAMLVRNEDVKDEFFLRIRKHFSEVRLKFVQTVESLAFLDQRVGNVFYNIFWSKKKVEKPDECSFVFSITDQSFYFNQLIDLNNWNY